MDPGVKYSLRLYVGNGMFNNKYTHGIACHAVCIPHCDDGGGWMGHLVSSTVCVALSQTFVLSYPFSVSVFRVQYLVLILLPLVSLTIFCCSVSECVGAGKCDLGFFSNPSPFEGHLFCPYIS